jgi:hypothetical protein
MSGIMLLLGLLTLLLLLDLASWRWGADSTDGRDWSNGR